MENAPRKRSDQRWGSLNAVAREESINQSLKRNGYSPIRITNTERGRKKNKEKKGKEEERGIQGDRTRKNMELLCKDLWFVSQIQQKSERKEKGNEALCWGCAKELDFALSVFGTLENYNKPRNQHTHRTHTEKEKQKEREKERERLGFCQWEMWD